jgi:predicted aminopeptidase
VKKKLYCFSGALLLLSITGCRTVSYYSQAVQGQYQIVSRQRPIKEILADPQTSVRLSNQLALVLKLHHFAERDLKLKANGHYLNYADVGRRFAVWNVYATPEFSLQAKTWWYPVVGSLKYRGYFNETAARSYGTNLAAQGYDVCVGGVEAYSTLGWFRDPVLNTFAFNSETDLAETLFHELAHQRVFISGDTDFNEAFATAVAEEGVFRWLLAQSNAVACARYQAERRRKDQFLSLLEKTRTELQAIYGEMESGIPGAKPIRYETALSDDEKRRHKAAAFDRLRQDYEQLKTSWGGNTEWDGWIQRPLNNAQLSTMDTYYRLVPAFHEVLRTTSGNLEKFYEEIQRTASLSKPERGRLFRAYLKPEVKSASASSR